MVFLASFMVVMLAPVPLFCSVVLLWWVQWLVLVLSMLLLPMVLLVLPYQVTGERYEQFIPAQKSKIHDFSTLRLHLSSLAAPVRGLRVELWWFWVFPMVFLLIITTSEHWEAFY